MTYNIWDVAKDLVTGNLEFADQETVEKRRSICETCEVRNATLNICTACGCHLPTKTKLKESSCPMELW